MAGKVNGLYSDIICKYDNEGNLRGEALISYPKDNISFDLRIDWEGNIYYMVGPLKSGVKVIKYEFK